MTSIKDAVAKLPQRVVKAEIEQAIEEKAKVRQTLYLPAPVHDQIRDAAHAKRVSQQKIFQAALDLWFEAEGLKSWAELTGKE